jgi:hypothetical protein
MTYLRQKVPPYVSKKLRDFARGQDCTLQLEGICNRNPETTVMCHIRAFGMSGIAMKPPDYHAVFACSACHDALDRRGTKAGVEWSEILRALMQTQQRVYEHFRSLTP